MKRPVSPHVYVIVLALAAVVSLGWAISGASFVGTDRVALFVLFSVLAVLAEVYATWVPAYNWEISSSIAVYLASLFILGPELAIISVFLACSLSELLLRPSSESDPLSERMAPIVFNVSQLVVTITAAGLILKAFGRAPLQIRSLADVAVAALSFAVYLALNLTFVTGIISVTERKPFLGLWIRGARQFMVQYTVLCATALLLTALYTLSVWHVLLGLFPLILVHVSFREVVRLQADSRSTFERISDLIDARDSYTGSHSREVADLAVRIGRQMGLSARQVDQLGIAGRVHDIGKIAIPDAILLKPGRLSTREWSKMKEHPVIGSQLIQGVDIYASVVDAVRHEHERWNGSGYPDGLKGEEIPLIARVIAVADVYHALRTHRPYRAALSEEEAIHTVREMSGEELDPV
ncbi:MAG TPA: HD-GYP domain-containing protein, partial [Candidatus Acetothermia bacterium]|nr:HD-GYP domain-containing protein [Candidatus Acetothermia bacterium]